MYRANPHPYLERYMTRTIRYAVLTLAVASISACSTSATEPTLTPAQKCVAEKNGTPESCAWLDIINPKV